MGQTNMLLLVWSSIIAILVNADTKESQCVEIPDADITEIDVLSFIEGSIDKKMEIAKQFDDAFHLLGAVRLINHGIPYQLIKDLLDKTAQFFDESDDFKMKLAKTGSNFHGFVPIGTETVGIYKGDKPDPVESLLIASNWNDKLEMQKGHPFRPKPDELPQYLGDIMPTYWAKTRELVYNMHWIASMALGFDIKNNVFEQNITANGLLAIRLSNYPTANIDGLDKNSRSRFRFNPHQDFTGFTMIVNDNIGGLQISVNDTNDNILWYKIPSKVGSIIILGGEFIERWTNSYWISSYHAVKSLPERRISIITFISPDLQTIIDILPCAKCMQSERKFKAVSAHQHLHQRMAATFEGHEIDQS